MLFGIVACSDYEMPEINHAGEELPELEQYDSWHDHIRTTPYPKSNNEVFVNPPPLIVHETPDDTRILQFAISCSPDFTEETTLMSEPESWHMFNLHRKLKTGTWYWRYRYYDGKIPREWSDTYSFVITSDIPVYVTPEADIFLENLPTEHPRIYCFLDYNLGNARNEAAKHPEYERLVNRGRSACRTEYPEDYDPYTFSNSESVKTTLSYLYDAYHITLESKYKNKMLNILRTVLLPNLPELSDEKLFTKNFGATNIAYSFAQIYDAVYEDLTSNERTEVERLLIRVGRKYYNMYCGMEENRFFDNHFWQHNMRVLFQISFLLWDKPEYSAECLEMLEYYYELWTARAPDGGHNRSGVWKNGTGYFNANIKTLFYMPMIFGALTGGDFLAHPWYRSAGQALAYTWPPYSATAGFGDGSEVGEPNRQRIAFADFLARENGDGYAAWYAGECTETLYTDVTLRLYRMITDKRYFAGELPVNHPKFLWYKDAGEVVIHSDIANPDRNLTVSFRSSTFGGNSHTNANQNSFNLLYKGVDVLCNGGYYVGDVNQLYNLLCYRHTRGHNSILVNGIGQPYSLEAYGCVLRAMGGSHIAYCLGDASHAYYGITDQKSWLNTFEKAGISQTPEYGFGETPLEKFKRHILVLFPSTVVIYDELEASEPVKWEWLLHSPQCFVNGCEASLWHLVNKEKKFRMELAQFGHCENTYSLTENTMVPITPKPDSRFPPLWHFTATSYGAKNRILTIIRLADESEGLSAIIHDGYKFIFDNWTVIASLDAGSFPKLEAKDSESGAVFSYSVDNPVLDSSVYLRKYSLSSLLYDESNGSYSITELGDYTPPYTRTLK